MGYYTAVECLKPFFFPTHYQKFGGCSPNLAVMNKICFNITIFTEVFGEIKNECNFLHRISNNAKSVEV